jgi:putative MATE family efflux protein
LGRSTGYNVRVDGARANDVRATGRGLDREIVRLAVPSIGVLAAEPLYVLVDTAIVGRLGTSALAGLAVAGTALTSFTWLCGFLTMGTTTRVAHARGAGDRRAEAVATVQAVLVALALGALAVVLFCGFTGPVVSILGAEGAAAEEARTYLRVGALGLPFQLLAFVGHGYWRGTSQVTRSLRVVLVANVVNVVLEVALIYALGWGIAGSALGTVCAQILAAAWLMAGVGREVRAAGVGLRPEPTELRILLRAGARITIRTLALVSVFLLATATAARLGEEDVAAHQIVMQLFTLLALLLDALAVPSQVLSGQALGAGRTDQVDAVVRRTLRAGVVVGLGLGAVLAALSPVLPWVFTDDGAVARAAIAPMLLLALAQPAGAVAFVMDGAFLGVGDYAFLQRAMLLAFLVVIPVDVLVLARPSLGLGVIWLGLAAWMAARAALTWFRWNREWSPARR